MFLSIKNRIKNHLIREDLVALRRVLDPHPHLQREVIELDTISELMKVFKWKEAGVLDRIDIHDFDYVEDANERRVRDAECIATVMANVKPVTALEIGTSNGMGTALMSVNSPSSKIFTVNIPPEEIISGDGGRLTTIALAKEKIGAVYRERGLNNIEQIFANTATWTPEIGRVNVAFIDGCHDEEFVYNDTKKVLQCMQPGDFILWHDFNPSLVRKFGWIGEVCSGVERLYEDGLIRGRIFNLRNSWVGIYQVK